MSNTLSKEELVQVYDRLINLPTTLSKQDEELVRLSATKITQFLSELRSEETKIVHSLLADLEAEKKRTEELRLTLKLLEEEVDDRINFAIKGHRKERETLRKIIDSLNARVETLEKENKELQTQLNNAGDFVEDSEKEIKKVRLEIKLLEEKNQKLAKRIDELLNELGDKVRKLAHSPSFPSSYFVAVVSHQAIGVLLGGIAFSVDVFESKSDAWDWVSTFSAKTTVLAFRVSEVTPHKKKE